MTEHHISKSRRRFRRGLELLLVVLAALTSLPEATAQWPNTEICTNGIDDDGDGMIDELDPSCNCFSLVEPDCNPDFEYLIPPVWHMNDERFGGQSELVVTTLESEANYIIRDGNGNEFYSGQARRGTATPIAVPSSRLQTNATNTPERDKGFVVVADAPVQILYRIGAEWNKILVTIKGRQALGKVFRAGSSTRGNPGLNDPEERHFVSVMAEEDDTRVTFRFPDGFDAYNIPGVTHTVTLSKHQTYLVRDVYPNNQSVSGTLVTSDKPISVVSGSQHTSHVDGADSKDGGVDQLVPVCVTGQDYAVVRGKGSPTMHFVTLVAVKANTQVTMTRPDGSTQAYNLTVGQATTIQLGGDFSEADFGKAFFFSGNIPYYLYQFSGVANSYEPGMAVSAPVGACRGDKLVDFARFSPTYYKDENRFKPSEHAVHVVVPTSGLGSLQFNKVPYASVVPAPISYPVPGGAGLTAVTFRDGSIKEENSIECDEYFSAAMLVGIDGSAGTFGYLSTFKGRMDFIDPATQEVTTGYTINSICNDDAVEHTIEVQSCASSHAIAKIEATNGTVTILGGTRFSYKPAAGFSGTDELIATVRNSEGFTQSICLSYLVCQRTFEGDLDDVEITCTEEYPKLVLPQGVDGCGNTYPVQVDSVRSEPEEDAATCTSTTVTTRRFYLDEDCGDVPVEIFQNITVTCDIVAPIEVTRSINRCEGDSYTFRGEEITTNTSRTYPVTVDGGCDSLVTIDFIFSSLPTTQLDPVRICEGETFDFGGQAYSTGGLIQAVYPTARGCDSTVTVQMTVVDTVLTQLTGGICEGSSYTFGGQRLTEAGTYIEVLTSEAGCDSTVVLELSLKGVVTATIDSSICGGESVYFGGTERTESGTYGDTLLTEQQCDSIVTLVLTVHGTRDTSFSASVCEGETYDFGERKLSEDGTYTQTFETVHGCDSVVTLELDVLDERREVVTRTICPGKALTYEGVEYTEAGSYDLTLASSLGCDSNVTLVVEVSALIEGADVTLPLCEGGSLDYDGITYTSTGEYPLRYTSAGGCDSVLTLIIERGPALSGPPVTLQLCPGGSVSYGGARYTRAGDFTLAYTTPEGCDSTVELSVVPAGLAPVRDTVDFCPGEQRIVNGILATGAGDYENEFTNQGGCDSTHVTTVRVRELSPVTVERVICVGESLDFDGESYSDEGRYTANLKTKYGGCDSTVTLVLRVIEAVAFTIDPVQTCEDVPVQLQVNGYEGPILWSPSEGLSCTDCPNPIYTGSLGGIYTASADGCGEEPVSAQVPIIVYEQLSAKIIGGEKSLFRGDSTRLVAESNADDEALRWYADADEICQGCREIVVYPLIPTRYALTATSEGGCDGVAELNLDVTAFDDCNDGAIHVPTAFSPNGDRVNDRLNVYTELVLEDVTFRVYDRWGSVMHIQQGQPVLWDGTIGGQEISAGVYVYTVTATCPDGRKIVRAGDVTLMR